MMKGIRFLIFIIVLPFLITGCGDQSAQIEEPVSLSLGTASLEGNYYPLGQSIASVITSIDSSVTVEVVETQGSVDNIRKLDSGELDLAIVQNDVAFFAENSVAPFETEISSLRGLATLYSEPIFLFTNDPSINYPAQLTNRMINVGPTESGLITDARIILNSFDLWSVTTKRNLSPIDGINALLNGDVDAAFTNAVPDSEKQEMLNTGIQLVPISPSNIMRIGRTYPYFSVFETEEFGTPQSTVAVKAILIGNERLNPSVVHQITRILYDNMDGLTFPDYSSPNREEIVSSMSLESFHEGARAFYEEIGLLESQTMFRLIWISLTILAILIIVIWILNTYLFPKYVRSAKYVSVNTRLVRYVKNAHKFVTRHKYIMVFFFMITSYITIMVLVKEIEHNWAIQNNVTSSFDNQTFFGNLLWIFIFGGSGYSDNIFPNSPIAKFLVTLIPLIGIGGFLTIAGLLTSDHIKNRLLKARGVKSQMIKDHIIICGWNENVPFLIQNLLHENIIHKQPIVLLADMDEDMPLEANNVDHDLVSFVRGDATKKADLDRANLKSAEVAIIVSDSNSSEPDAKSILKILTVEKYGRELEREGLRTNRDNIYTIAEIQDTENFDTAYDADVDEIISLGHIKSKILVHSVLNPGVSNFINEILTYNDFNDIYSINLDKNSTFIEQTFDELLVKLRRKQILLLGISIGNHKSRKEIRAIQEKLNLNRTVLTNPITEREINYETQPGDLLIVLAQYESTIQEALSDL